MPTQIVPPAALSSILQQLPTLRDSDFSAYCLFRLVWECGLCPGESLEVAWNEVHRHPLSGYRIHRANGSAAIRSVPFPAATHDDLVEGLLLSESGRIVPAATAFEGSTIALRLELWLRSWGADNPSLWLTALDRIARTVGIPASASAGQVSPAWLTAWLSPLSPALAPIAASGSPVASKWMARLHLASAALRASDPAAYALYLLSAEGGLRPEEALNLKWQHLLSPGAAGIRPGHQPTDYCVTVQWGYRWRYLPLSAPAMQTLVSLGEIGLDSAFVIPASAGLTANSLGTRLKRWIERVLVGHVPVGFLRHMRLRQLSELHGLDAVTYIGGASRRVLRSQINALR